MSGIVTLPWEQFAPGKEGTFAIPNEIYHDHSKVPGLSRTILVELLTKSPAHARGRLLGKSVKPPTGAMTGGTLFDLALLEPENFKEGVSHWVIPLGMKLTTKDGIAWKKEHPGLPYLRTATDAGDKVSVEDVKGMIESVMAHKKARVIIEKAVKQESAFCVHPTTGVLRKVRPDARMSDTKDRPVLADIKSTF